MASAPTSTRPISGSTTQASKRAVFIERSNPGRRSPSRRGPACRAVASPTIGDFPYGGAVRARLPPAVAALVVLGAGLGVRAVTGGVFAKYAGVALYATFVATLVLVV